MVSLLLIKMTKCSEVKLKLSEPDNFPFAKRAEKEQNLALGKNRQKEPLTQNE